MTMLPTQRAFVVETHLPLPPVLPAELPLPNTHPDGTIATAILHCNARVAATTPIKLHPDSTKTI